MWVGFPPRSTKKVDRGGIPVPGGLPRSPTVKVTVTRAPGRGRRACSATPVTLATNRGCDVPFVLSPTSPRSEVLNASAGAVATAAASTAAATSNRVRRGDVPGEDVREPCPPFRVKAVALIASAIARSSGSPSRSSVSSGSANAVEPVSFMV